MTTVCTIYWNDQQHQYHWLVSEVEVNGSHKVIQSDLFDCVLSAVWVRQNAIERFGEANVRFYKVEEVK
jgi:hypothetical protein